MLSIAGGCPLDSIDLHRRWMLIAAASSLRLPRTDPVAFGPVVDHGTARQEVVYYDTYGGKQHQEPDVLLHSTGSPSPDTRTSHLTHSGQCTSSVHTFFLKAAYMPLKKKIPSFNLSFPCLLGILPPRSNDGVVQVRGPRVALRASMGRREALPPARRRARRSAQGGAASARGDPDRGDDGIGGGGTAGGW